ncbi:retrovirus-related Pol polyprotein from transposon 17.6 [Trichonephila clavipes]|nr:retrovirus-related Pol polyprotein from transposon 17.6 [Trichonephila clavipes]
MIRWALKLSEFNIEWEHRPGVQNVVADLLSRNPVDSVEGSQISCAALRALAINSREQFIKEQREDPELGHIYRYLENPDDGSVNATVCESWSQDFKLINGLPSFTRTRYGAPISLISDNGPQFISDVFEHLSHRLDIKHMKTVTYRPQSNLTERVNRNLVQMIASFVKENHENWDQFLHEFAFALRTAVNETTNKTPAELFLGRKIITPFSKLINVKEDAKYVGNNIERLFDEARRNMQKQRRSWEKHYNLRRRDVHIKVNDLVLLQTHFLSAAGKKQVGKLMPKFEGPYKYCVEGPSYKRSKICRKRSRQGSNHQDRKRHAPEQRRGVKGRSFLVLVQNNKFQRHSSSPGVKSIAGPSKLPDRRTATTTGGSRMEVSGRDNQTRQTRATTRRHNEQAEKTIRSNQTNTRRPLPILSTEPYTKRKDRIHENLNNIEINGIPGSIFRRRSLSIESDEWRSSP